MTNDKQLDVLYKKVNSLEMTLENTEKELYTLKAKVKSKWYLLDIFEAFYNNLEYIEKGDIN